METMTNLLQLFPPRLFVAPALLGLAVALVALVWAFAQQVEHRKFLKAGAVRRSVHEKVHASGETSYYFDTDVFLGLPANIGKASYWLVRVVEQLQHEFGKLDRLCFIDKAEGPVGAVTLRDLASWQTNIPAITVRLRGDFITSDLRIKGMQAAGASGINVLRAGERVLVVSDVATSGGTILDAVKIITDAGGTVSAAVALFDREEGALANLHDAGVKLVCYLKKSEVERLLPNAGPSAEAA